MFTCYISGVEHLARLPAAQWLHGPFASGRAYSPAGPAACAGLALEAPGVERLAMMPYSARHGERLLDPAKGSNGFVYMRCPTLAD